MTVSTKLHQKDWIRLAKLETKFEILLFTVRFLIPAFILESSSVDILISGLILLPCSEIDEVSDDEDEGIAVKIFIRSTNL